MTQSQVDVLRLSPAEELIIIQTHIGGETAGIQESIMAAARNIVLEENPVVKAEKLADVLRDNAINTDFIPQIVQSVLDANSRAERLENELANYTHDSRTGLPTKRYYEAWFPDVLSGLRRNIDREKQQPQQIQMILFDVDKFKLVNDTLGHVQGDDVLAEVGIILGDELGRIIREEIRRASDGVFRWGGEEYAGLLFDCDIEIAAAKADQVRQRIQDTPIYVHGMEEPVHITISAGVSTLNLQPGLKGDTQEIIDNLTEQADIALYVAKEQRGRNTVLRRDRVTPEELEVYEMKKTKANGKPKVDAAG